MRVVGISGTFIGTEEEGGGFPLGLVLAFSGMVWRFARVLVSVGLVGIRHVAEPQPGFVHPPAQCSEESGLSPVWGCHQESCWDVCVNASFPLAWRPLGVQRLGAQWVEAQLPEDQHLHTLASTWLRAPFTPGRLAGGGLGVGWFYLHLPMTCGAACLSTC